MNLTRTFGAWLFDVRIGRTTDWSRLARLAPVIQLDRRLQQPNHSTPVTIATVAAMQSPAMP
jgi:hypothetical protein